jgi:hypothetical protein
MTTRGTFVLAAALGLAALSFPALAADPPDFSGSWRLDRTRSDDVKARVEEAAGSAQASGGTSPLTILPVPGTKASVERVEMREAMLKLVDQLDRLEIEHHPTEIKLFHGDEIARTFYFGREHVREDFMGRKLKCRSKWKGGQLTLEEDGDKGRRRLETLTLVPAAGLLIEAVRWEDGLLKKPLEVRLVYVREAAGGTRP